MSTVLLTFLFFGSLGGVLFIVIRHLPSVSLLRPEELTHIRHEQLKTDLLLSRFRRIVQEPWDYFFRNIRRWSILFGGKFYRLLHVLKALEHHYEKLALQKNRTAMNAATVVETGDGLTAQAKELQEKGLFDDAERKYIAAIALDPKLLSAYEGLGELYFQKKDFEAARETYAHIVKLNERSAEAHARLGAIASASGNLTEAEQDYAKAAELANDLVSSHIDLGVVHEALGKHEDALVNFLKARELEPKNPRVLDALFATAIMVGNKALAEEVFAELKAVNPENQKLEELQKRIAEIPVEEAPAKKSRRKKSDS